MSRLDSSLHILVSGSIKLVQGVTWPSKTDLNLNNHVCGGVVKKLFGQAKLPTVVPKA